MKRACFALCAILALCSCILSGCSDTSSSDENGSGSSSNKIILHAYNYVNVYVWNSSNSDLDERHFHLQSEGDGWYTTTLEASYTSLFFTTKYDSFMEQTEDSYRTGGEWWYKDGCWYDYKPSGGASSGGNGENGDNSGNEGGSGGESSESWTSDIYLEIMMFSNMPNDFNGGTFVKFDSTSVEEFKEKLKSSYKMNSTSATALNYAVHKALVNLSENESSLPDDLQSVNIITFTDGLDTSSDLMSQTNPLEGKKFNVENDYGKWIKNQIDTRSVAGQNLNCYSVGVQGDDINPDLFTNTLANITSNGIKPYVSQNFNTIASDFSNIANGLVVDHNIYDFNLRVPSGATSVRMVFDGVTQAQNSFLYFDGSISQHELDYIIKIERKCGVELDDEQEIQGTVEYDDDGYPTGLIVYELKNIRFSSITDNTTILDMLSNKDKCKQFFKSNNSTFWQHNREYDVDNNYNYYQEHFSTVIYLILDATRSLGDDIDKVRDAAIQFIDALAEKVKVINDV